jgi:hypothetical protein
MPDEQEKSADNAQEDFLKGLNLSEEEVKQLKTNENLLGLVTHLTDQKRTANAEAKKYRELMEKIESDKKAKQEEDLKKQGEYEKLYQEAEAKLQATDEAIKKAVINGELGRLAGSHGLLKKEYLKLIDASSLEVDIESMSVKDVEEMFAKFKEENPSLFKSEAGAGTSGSDTAQPKTKGAQSDKLDLWRKLKDKKEKSQTDVTRLFALERELKKEGLI